MEFCIVLVLLYLSKIRCMGHSICSLATCNEGRKENVTLECSKFPLRFPDQRVSLESTTLVPEDTKRIVFDNCLEVSINNDHLTSHNTHLKEIVLINVSAFEIRLNYSLKNFVLLPSAGDSERTLTNFNIHLESYEVQTNPCELKFSSEKEHLSARAEGSTSIATNGPDVDFTGCKILSIKENSFTFSFNAAPKITFCDCKVEEVESVRLTRLELLSLRGCNVSRVEKYGFSVELCDKLEISNNRFGYIGYHGFNISADEVEIRSNSFNEAGNNELAGLRPKTKHGNFHLKYTKNIVQNVTGSKFLFEEGLNLNYENISMDENAYPCDCSTLKYFNKAINEYETVHPNRQFLMNLKTKAVCIGNKSKTLASVSQNTCRELSGRDYKPHNQSTIIRSVILTTCISCIFSYVMSL
ncbi:uncharacterized protein LOC136028825 [Artemia franciscana]|uniref:uncharacterized protein LOC136028825 n=1 Tax=Artemia franciscana TaxID=6661 RepID=UPI0032DB31B3